MGLPATIPEVEILGTVARLQIHDAHLVLNVPGTITPHHGKSGAGDGRALETILEGAGYGSVGFVHPGSLDIEIGDL